MMSSIPSPEEFYGFPMGADRKLARWDKIYQYFKLLDERSERIETIDLGQTTEGNTFVLTLISSSANLARHADLKKIARQLSRAKDLTEGEARELAKEGKAIVVISCSIHSSEQVGTQMASELAYQLVSSNSADTKAILDDVVLLLFPCVNPDGQIMVTDWYNKWLDTEYEGCPLPWLYHKYTGHDNNRDSYMLTQKESQMFGKILYTEWYPQIHIDVHQMGGYGARFYVPPWCDPLHPNIDPLIWREGQLLGAFVAADLEAAGITGVENATSFAGWNMGGWCKYAGYLHQIAGTFETASIKIASPIYVHPDQLQPSNTPRGRSSGTEPQMIFPHPWPGGWWRFRDMVQQNLIGAMSVLSFAAQNKEKILTHMYIKMQRSVEKGKNEAPSAYLIPEDQHDSLTAIKLLQTLMQSEIEIHQAMESFRVGYTEYPSGTYVLFMAQPLRPAIKTFFEKTSYPDNEFTRDKEGRPARGQLDLATWTLGEFMGVDAIQVDEPLKGSFKQLNEINLPPGQIIGASATGYLLSPQYNDSYVAINSLLYSNVRVERIENAVTLESQSLPVGTFFIPAQDNVEGKLSDLAQRYGLKFLSRGDTELDGGTRIKHARLGIYQGYNGGNMDEGWCRWVLEQNKFRYQTLRDSEIHADDLNDQFDVILFTDDTDAAITGLGLQESVSEMKRGMPNVPQEYRSGIGEKGINQIRAFVENGGSVLTFGNACHFAIKRLQLPIKNVAENLRTDEYWCPGSTLRVRHDNGHRLAYGMPQNGIILGVNQPVFQIQPNEQSDRYRIATRYQNKDVLQSGRLVGERLLCNQPVLIEALYGKGRVILYSFRPHFRAQTHGTYKLFFSALFKYDEVAQIG